MEKPRDIYLCERAFPPKFKALSLDEATNIMISQRWPITKVTLYFVDPWWLLPYMLLTGIAKVPFIGRLAVELGLTLIEASHSVVIQVREVE